MTEMFIDAGLLNAHMHARDARDPSKGEEGMVPLTSASEPPSSFFIKELRVVVAGFNRQANRSLVAENAPPDRKYVNFYALQYLWTGAKGGGGTYTFASGLSEQVDKVRAHSSRGTWRSPTRNRISSAETAFSSFKRLFGSTA